MRVSASQNVPFVTPKFRKLCFPQVNTLGCKIMRRSNTFIPGAHLFAHTHKKNCFQLEIGNKHLTSGGTRFESTPTQFSTPVDCGKCSPVLQLLEYRKASSKLQLPGGEEARLFPSRAVALWERIGNLAAYVGEKGGLGEVWKS